MKNLIFSMFTIAGVLSLYSCDEVMDNRESIAMEYLKAEIASVSKGAFRLDSFSKTNGYDQNFMGQNFYVLEWQADVSVQKECWQQKHTEGFSVMTQLPSPKSYYENLCVHFPEGATIHYTGDCHFINTEKGWRVDNLRAKIRNVFFLGD